METGKPGKPGTGKPGTDGTFPYFSYEWADDCFFPAPLTPPTPRETGETGKPGTDGTFPYFSYEWADDCFFPAPLTPPTPRAPLLSLSSPASKINPRGSRKSFIPRSKISGPGLTNFADNYPLPAHNSLMIETNQNRSPRSHGPLLPRSLALLLPPSLTGSCLLLR